jgi:hypothetical protein
LFASGWMGALRVLSCGRWCPLAFCGAIGGKETIENFEDREKKLEELKSFFYSLYTWTAVFLAPMVISFNDFLVLFSHSS